MDQIVIKLLDFGFAIRKRKEEKITDVVGTICYAAPEVLEGKQQTEKIDVWSVGILFYEMLMGQPPFVCS